MVSKNTIFVVQNQIYFKTPIHLFMRMSKCLIYRYLVRIEYSDG